MQNIEIEYKILISHDIFQKILQDYHNQIHNDYIQINHYFTHPLLEEKKYMLRIREKDNSFELTLKRPFQDHRIETNVKITPHEKDMMMNHHTLHNEIMDILDQKNIPQVQLENHFSLKTHRYDIILPQGILSLDENFYLNQHDYELEFEVNNEEEGYQKFLEIIQPYSLVYIKNSPSKIKRVLDSL